MKYVLILSALGLLGACSDASLKLAAAQPPPPRDDRLSLTGSVCSEAPQPVDFPLRVLFVVDVSGSMAITDPAPPNCMAGPGNCLARRGQAIYDVVNTYPPGNGVEYAIIRFDEGSGVLTKNAAGNDGFTSDKNQVISSLPVLNTSLTTTSGQTNFDSALTKAFQILQVDMTSLDTTARARARYVVVFMSDGFPEPSTATANNEATIRANVKAIKQLQTDQQLGEVVLHSVFLVGPTIQTQDQVAPEQLLASMAQLAGGSFRTFAQGDKLSFFYIDFRSFIRDFLIKNFLVSNVNTMLRDGVSQTDSDGDGLLDTDEVIYGTNPYSRDSDNDGFNDLLEVRLRGAGFDPNFPDSDCTVAVDFLDEDGDGLLNCEERFIGTNSRLNDTDADGLPDYFEFLSGSNPVASDALVDDDSDGNRNGTELSGHMNPEAADSQYLSQAAYRYAVNEQTTSVMPGQHCYDFSVENVTLVPTASANGMPGDNMILLQMISAPADSPNDFGDHQIACVKPSYQFLPDEIKRPASGKMIVPLSAFKKASRAPSDPPTVEVFDASKDCVSP